LNAIRMLCMAVALTGMLATGSVQAQEPASAQAQSEARTVASAPDDVFLTEVSQDQVSQTQLSQNQISQDQVSQDQDPPQTAKPADGKSSAPTNAVNSSDQSGKQSKRILGIVPNFRAVSANTYLPPLRFKSKLWLATQDSFDYSNFIFVAGLSGIDMAGKSEPTFGQGAEGYGKYYWHVFADTGIENYMAEAIVPLVTKEDPRYYTLDKGGFLKRTGYAVSRLFITRTDAGNSSFNFSEIVGAGGAAGISNFYYPSQQNHWVKTYQRWVAQVSFDGMFNVIKEFWPTINDKIFHGKY
jgi:hypothetical protein